jgi:hypothetical protein
LSGQRSDSTSRHGLGTVSYSVSIRLKESSWLSLYLSCSKMCLWTCWRNNNMSLLSVQLALILKVQSMITGIYSFAQNSGWKLWWSWVQDPVKNFFHTFASFYNNLKNVCNNW